MIRKLPEVDFLSRDRQILDGAMPLWFSMQSSAGFLDRTEPDFQTRQFVSRLDVNPELSTAFHWAGFSLLPSFGDSRDRIRIQPGERRAERAEHFAQRARSQCHPDSAVAGADLQSAQMAGRRKAEARYRAAGGIPFVDGINNFNRIIRFDENDLLTNTNQVTLSVANRLFVKDKDGNVNEVLSWELSQARYFDPTFGGAVIPGQRNVIVKFAWSWTASRFWTARATTRRWSRPCAFSTSSALNGEWTTIRC